MSSPASRFAYMLVLIFVGAISSSESHDSWFDTSWLWPVLLFLLFGLFMLVLVLLDISGRRSGRGPKWWVHPLQASLFSPTGLRLLGLGFFALGVGAGFRAAFVEHSYSPSQYFPLAMGLGSVIGLYLGERIVYGDERNGT